MNAKSISTIRRPSPNRWGRAPLVVALLIVLLAGLSVPSRPVAAADCDISAYPNLAGVDLSYCNLNSVNLVNADLSGANLSGAIMYLAALSNSNLSGANLTGTNLSATNMLWVNLTGANLTGASLSNAYLVGANLTGADLTGADLSYANLDGVIWSNTTCPDGTNSDANGGTCEGHLNWPPPPPPPPPPPSYTFSGFFSPVDNQPALNKAKAGSGIPVNFSLGGDQDLDIFADGYPKSVGISCPISDEVDPIEETVSAGNSSLSYDPATDTYTYVWKTQKSWAKSCRQLIVQLDDGSEYVADFQFTK